MKTREVLGAISGCVKMNNGNEIELTVDGKKITGADVTLGKVNLITAVSKPEVVKKATPKKTAFKPKKTGVSGISGDDLPK